MHVQDVCGTYAQHTCAVSATIMALHASKIKGTAEVARCAIKFGGVLHVLRIPLGVKPSFTNKRLVQLIDVVFEILALTDHICLTFDFFFIC